MIRRLMIACSVLLLLLCVSCKRNTAYHKYIAIDQEGWFDRDTLKFFVDTFFLYGDYVTSVCVRTKENYPYHNLALIVEQEVKSTGKKQRKEVQLEIVDEYGVQEGQGITYRTYEAPLFQEWLGPHDSVSVRVRHHMTRETMPGIADVGIKIARKEK